MFGVEPTQMLLTNYRKLATTLLKESNSTPLYVINDLPVGALWLLLNLPIVGQSYHFERLGN